jgi:hypothetical protein
MGAVGLGSGGVGYCWRPVQKETVLGKGEERILEKKEDIYPKRVETSNDCQSREKMLYSKVVQGRPGTLIIESEAVQLTRISRSEEKVEESRMEAEKGEDPLLWSPW